MLLVAFGEGVAAGAVGHEVELSGARGIGRGFKRGATRIGDRAGRQSIDLIGVVRRRLIDLALHDRTAERALAADQSVYDRRIRLQPHSLLEPVHEHGGDARTLVRLAGLLFDQRGQDHELFGRLERKIGRRSGPYVRHQTLLRMLHVLDQLRTRHAAGEIIGVGQQRPFGGNFVDVSGQHVVVHQSLNDLLRCQAFGDADLVHHHLAFAHGGDDVAQARVRLEFVLAGLEPLVRFQEQRADDEDPGLIDDAILRDSIR